MIIIKRCKDKSPLQFIPSFCLMGNYFSFFFVLAFTAGVHPSKRCWAATVTRKASWNDPVSSSVNVILFESLQQNMARKQRWYDRQNLCVKRQFRRSKHRTQLRVKESLSLFSPQNIQISSEISHGEPVAKLENTELLANFYGAPMAKPRSCSWERPDVYG